MRHGTHDGPVRPDGGKKRKQSRLKASRSPVYLPTASTFKSEQAMWLQPRRHA